VAADGKISRAVLKVLRTGDKLGYGERKLRAQRLALWAGVRQEEKVKGGGGIRESIIKRSGKRIRE